MTREFWIECYRAYREAGWPSVEWRPAGTPRPIPLAIYVNLCWR